MQFCDPIRHSTNLPKDTDNCDLLKKALPLTPPPLPKKNKKQIFPCITLIRKNIYIYMYIMCFIILAFFFGGGGGGAGRREFLSK